MKQEKKLRHLSSLQFSMWEMRIFLDTHPNDEEALSLFEEYTKQYKECLKEYEEEFGPLTLTGNNSDEWLSNPWPWDN